MTKNRAVHTDDDVINEYHSAIEAGKLVKMGLHETAAIIFKGKSKSILLNTLIGKI